MRARRVWFGVTETVSFFAAATAAVGRFLFGRWPEPPGRDFLDPKGRSPKAGEETASRPGLTSRKAVRRRRRLDVGAIRGEPR